MVGDGIAVIRGGGAVRGWNGIRYRAGLSAKNVGATKLSMNVATIPPGGVAYAATLTLGQAAIAYFEGGGQKRVRRSLESVRPRS